MLQILDGRYRIRLDLGKFEATARGHDDHVQFRD